MFGTENEKITGVDQKRLRFPYASVVQVPEDLNARQVSQ